MPWNETHYSRAAEFVQLVASAIGPVPVAVAPAAIAPPRPLEPAKIPKPAAPTTAAVFKSIPWKK